MKNRKSFLSPDFLSEAAFMLLSCSTLSRYIRIAKSFAESSPIHTKIGLGQLSIENDLIKRADYLWRVVQKSKQRDIAEIELAIILPTVAKLAVPEASDILVRISINDQPPATWLSGLARHLFHRLAANEEFQRATSGTKFQIERPTEVDYETFEYSQQLTRISTSATEDSDQTFPKAA